MDIFNISTVCAPSSEVFAHTPMATPSHSWTQSRFPLKTEKQYWLYIRHDASSHQNFCFPLLSRESQKHISKLMVPPPCATLLSTPQGKNETTGRKTLQAQSFCLFELTVYRQWRYCAPLYAVLIFNLCFSYLHLFFPSEEVEKKVSPSYINSLQLIW